MPTHYRPATYVPGTPSDAPPTPAAPVLDPSTDDTPDHTAGPRQRASHFGLAEEESSFDDGWDEDYRPLDEVFK